MKVKALINYTDLELNKDINANEVYEVTEERAKVLLKGNASSGYKPFIQLVKEAVEEVETADMKAKDVETAVKPRRKKTNKE